jgi:hypothetical protein
MVPSSAPTSVVEPEKDLRRPNGSAHRHDIPPAVRPPQHRPGHGLPRELTSSHASKCSPTSSSAVASIYPRLVRPPLGSLLPRTPPPRCAHCRSLSLAISTSVGSSRRVTVKCAEQYTPARRSTLRNVRKLHYGDRFRNRRCSPRGMRRRTSPGRQVHAQGGALLAEPTGARPQPVGPREGPSCANLAS